MNPRLEQWSVLFRPLAGDCYTPPELLPQVLNGYVHGHPNYQDGHCITTSHIKGRRGEAVITRSGSAYELGEPHPQYAAQFPDPKPRLLNSLPEI